MNGLEKFLASLVEEDKTPSVQYKIFNKDSLLYSYGSGYANILNRDKVNEKTTYNLFSVTKTFTALSIMQLCQLHKIDIEKSVKLYLPDFPYSQEITIRHLLTHTSGIPNPLPLNWIHLTTEHSSFDRNLFFDEIFSRYNKTRSGPNDKFSYSNLGFVFLGRIIEKVSGMTYEQYLKDNILPELDLDTDDLWFTINNPSQHAHGYQKSNSVLNLMLGLFLDKSKYLEKEKGSWRQFKDFYVNGISYGGLIGTSNSLVRYVQELLKDNSRLISDDYKKIMFTENYTNNHRATGMCLAWFTGELNKVNYYTHAGGGGGYYSEIRLYPQSGIGSIILFNRTGISDERFLDKTDRFIIGK